MVGVFFVRCVGYCYRAQEDDGGARMEKLEKRPDTVLDIFLRFPIGQTTDVLTSVEEC